MRKTCELLILNLIVTGILVAMWSSLSNLKCNALGLRLSANCWSGDCDDDGNVPIFEERGGGGKKKGGKGGKGKSKGKDKGGGGDDGGGCSPEVVAIKKTRVIPVAVAVRNNKRTFAIKVPQSMMSPQKAMPQKAMPPPQLVMIPAPPVMMQQSHPPPPPPQQMIEEEIIEEVVEEEPWEYEDSWSSHR
ncbi:uncharacterized protein LOC141855616 [Brevipalpus obovatus]|uniref:uncharacterized protein LOC141855616 n=1 Tax=Brevipalpus obovatus TaxID=246614 RepID=UPI003D9ED737